MQNDIISLQEIAENSWQAKYQGNYGIYKIKIKLDKGKIIDFSCSCPSDYSPCKHIGMIKDAIDSRMAKNKNNPKEDTISVEELLQNVPHKELVKFIVSQAKYDPELTNKLLLEFLQQAPGKQENSYSLALRNSLKNIDLDFDDDDENEDLSIEIDVLPEWFSKAREYISQKRFDEAIAICKACIGETAEWLEEIEEDYINFIDPMYMETPFELLLEIATHPEINSSELFEYCLSEMDEPKYSASGMDDTFNNILANLVKTKNEFKRFIELQDSLLQDIKDKSSYEAQKIIQRKVAFYRKHNQPEMAWQLIVENIQIESFRKQVVQQKISEGKLAEAKKLIVDILDTINQDNRAFYKREWEELALTIAQKENDVPVIRKIAYAFIEYHFEENHYRIYKSSFNSNEWEKEVQNIIAHYENKEMGFNHSVADVLAEEHDSSSLITYIGKHLNIERLDQYHSHFASSYPTETLDLFQKVINPYIDKNTGRNYYEYVAGLIKKIVLIEGGKEMATTMIAHYKNQYKNRRAMIEIFDRVHF